MFDMINIFEVFLPQLLRYPNPTDPLNGEAAALLMREPKSYEAKVKGKYSHQVLGHRDAKLKFALQSMFLDTRPKMPPMMLELKATMTTICPRWARTAMMTKSRRARWKTSRAC